MNYPFKLEEELLFSGVCLFKFLGVALSVGF